MGRKSYHPIIWSLLQLVLGSGLYAQSNALVNDLPEYLRNIRLDTTKVDKLLKDGYSSIEGVDTTDYGWVEWNMPNRELIAVTHLLDLSNTIRYFFFTPKEKYILSNGIIINESTLLDVEQTTGKENFYSDNPQIFTDDIVYHFIKEDTTFILNKIKVKNKGRTNFYINFLLDTEGLQLYFDALVAQLDSTTINLDSDLHQMALELGLLRDETDIRDEMFRKLENGLSQVQFSFNHYFLRSKVNYLFQTNKNGESQSRYFSLIFDDQHIYSKHYRQDSLNYKDTDQIERVGYFCSVSGSPPRKMWKTLDLINDGNYKEFITWMNSMNPEIRLYGAVGLMMYRFQYKNNVRSDVVNLMNKILSGNQKIYGCITCFYGNYAQQEVVNIRELFRMYKIFVSHGFIYD